jgi:hypothetical protein
VRRIPQWVVSLGVLLPLFRKGEEEEQEQSELKLASRELLRSRPLALQCGRGKRATTVRSTFPVRSQNDSQ